MLVVGVLEDPRGPGRRAARSACSSRRTSRGSSRSSRLRGSSRSAALSGAPAQLADRRARVRRGRCRRSRSSSWRTSGSSAAGAIASRAAAVTIAGGDRPAVLAAEDRAPLVVLAQVEVAQRLLLEDRDRHAPRAGRADPQVVAQRLGQRELDGDLAAHELLGRAGRRFRRGGGSSAARRSAAPGRQGQPAPPPRRRASSGHVPCMRSGYGVARRISLRSRP